MKALIDKEKRRRLEKAESNYVLDHNHVVDTPRTATGFASKYSDELKAAVLNRIKEIGSVREAALEFKVPRTTVNEWVRWNSVPRGE